MRKRTKSLIGIVIISLFILLTACSGGSQETSEKNSEGTKVDSYDQIRVGGAATTTFAYGFLSAWAEILQKTDNGFNFVIQATPGSTVHYEMIEKGELDLGAGFAPTEYMAQKGEREPYNGTELTKFRILFPTSNSFAHVFTTADSKLETVQDLEGVRLGLPGRGSSTTLTAEYQLIALGVQPDIVYAQADELRNMLQDGRIDAVWHYAGAPWSAILEFSSQVNTKFITFSEEDIKKIAEAEPYTSLGLIDSDYYEFIEGEIITPVTFPTVLASSDLDDDLIYQITKATWENWDKIAEIVPAAGQVTMDDVTKLVGTIHPGALRYYEEQGVEIPEHLK